MIEDYSRVRDIRETDLFADVESFAKRIRQPGTGHISEIADFDITADGTLALLSGVMMDRLEGLPTTRVCLVDLKAGTRQVLTFGPNIDKTPKFAPNGKRAAFLSDRRTAGVFQLYFLDVSTGIVLEAPVIEGCVDSFVWSPDGSRIVLIVAESGSDSSSLQGAMTSGLGSEAPSWMPDIRRTDQDNGRRRLWLLDLAGDRLLRFGDEILNAWEAVWCGNSRIAVIASNGDGEDAWYTACLWLVDTTGASRILYKPGDQLGGLSASQNAIALIEGIASDRGSVAGSLLLVDAASASVDAVDTQKVDITATTWRNGRLIVAGHRTAESVVLERDTNGAWRELWASDDVTSIGRYMNVTPLADPGTFAFVAQGFSTPHALAIVSNGLLRRHFQAGSNDIGASLAAAQHCAWQAPDGMEIEGWLLKPHGAGPFPLVTWIHGGPTWHWRPFWLGGTYSLTAAMLLRQGYAIFLPNPRGSTGRGQHFARLVKGDEGGADTHDILSGIDALVASGDADAMRLGVTGLSYGGYMSAWLVTQDRRFAAAVPMSPGTDRISLLFTTNIPTYVMVYLVDAHTDPKGGYFTRSPVMFAQNAQTPTLTICGALDRCTPPEQALEFHNALRLAGCPSRLAIYPGEGHGVRSYPAAIDCAVRSTAWFKAHMPASPRD